MSDEALFKKGLPIRREVLGPEYVDSSLSQADSFMMAFQRATTASSGRGGGHGAIQRSIAGHAA